MRQPSKSSSNEKVSASTIKDVVRFDVESAEEITKKGIYKLNMGDIILDLAFLPKGKAGAAKAKNAKTPKYLFVFFCDYVDRKAYQLPTFQRWGWHTDFPGHCLYISDPFLSRTEDLGLGWYIGERTKDANPIIADTVRKVAAGVNVLPENIIFYGSSGGGFAALRALVEIPEAQAIAINPQTRLTNFKDGYEDGYNDSLSRYLSVFFDGMTKSDFHTNHSFRNTIVSRVEKIASSRIVYVQNVSDDHHMTQHLTQLFSNESGEWKPIHLKNAELVFFDDKRGHGVAESKTMVPALLASCGVSV